MARNPRRVRAQLQELYAELPQMQCRGLCQQSCGPIEMSTAERQIIEAKHGPVHTVPPESTCSMLRMGRCLAYEDRPMLCRLWGVIESMPCPWGCVPEGGWLSDGDGMVFLGRAFEISGDDPLHGMPPRVWRELLSMPGLHEFFRDYVAHGMSADAGRRRTS